MKIDRLSPSSYGSWDGCQQKYFIEQNLKYTYPPGKAADKGTVTHSVLETLALMKLGTQNDPQLNKYTYKDVDFDPYNPDIELLCDTAIKAFKPGYFDLKECKEIKKWVDTALNFNNGEYNPLKRNIVQPEKRIKVEIEEDWGILEDGKRFYLSGIIDSVSKIDDNTYEVLDWKGLPVDTEILTSTGWSTMGNLKEGDTIFDKDGKPTKILGKSKQTYKECYEITFDDTSKATCDFEHLWLLSNGTVVDAPNLKIGDKIDVAKPLNFERKDLPLDPYVLGIWLGDGRNRCGEITNADQFIFDEIERRGYKLGFNQDKRGNKAEARTIYGTTKHLKALNLLHNKHIPEIYLQSAYSQRLDLLRGLMDSDGCVNSVRKHGIFSNSHKPLIDSVKLLLLSLGQRPLVSTLNDRVTNFKSGFTTYVISFRPQSINPFLLPRKADRMDPNWGPGKSNRREIIKVEKLKVLQKTQCIKVDSPSSTFLCTRNLIPTHNTGSLQDFNTGKTKNYENLLDDPQLRFYHWACTKLFGEDKTYFTTIFFLKSKDCFSLPFSMQDVPRTKYMLRDRFLEIKGCQQPKLNISWKCKWCPFGNKTAVGTNLPLFSDFNPTSKTYEKLTICETVKKLNEEYDIDFIAEKFSKNAKKE